MRSSGSRLRRALPAVCLAFGLWTGAAPALAQEDSAPEERVEPAPAEAPAPAHRVAIASGILSPAFESARAALAERVRLRLADARVSVVAPPAGHAEGAVQAAVTSCARVARAAPGDASELVVVDLRAVEAGVDVALRVYDRASCELHSAARARGSATQLGGAIDAVVARVAAGLDGTPDRLGPPRAASAEQLASESRALARFAAGELARAWRELDRNESPLARSLRDRIDARISESGVSAAERLRLRIARGEVSSNEVSTRKLLTDAARALESPDEPLEPRAFLAAGEIRLSRGEAEAARPYLEKAIALEPANPDAQLAYGRTLALLADDTAARRAFERASQLELDSSRALEELAQLDAHEPTRQAAVLLRAADRAASGLAVERATSTWARAAQLDPSKAPMARERAAVLATDLADPAQSRARWQAAIDADGTSSARLLGVARAARALGDGAGAEKLLRQALDQDPRAAGAARELGVVLRGAGRGDEAKELFSEAVALDGADVEAKLELAALLAESQGDAAAAVPLLDAAERARGASPKSLQIRAQLASARGDEAAARDALTHAVELDPIDPELRLALADATQALGDGAGAALERERAALLLPDSDALADRSAQNRAGSSIDLTGVGDRIPALVQSFAAVEPETGRIVFAGVRERLTPREQLLDWLRPRVPDLEKISGQVKRVLASEYALMPDAELATALENVATAGGLEGLYRFESLDSRDAEAPVQLNLVLETDALFLARLYRQPAASGDGAPACAGDSPWRLELRELTGRSLQRARAYGNSVCLSPDAEEYLRWNPRAAILPGLLILIVGALLVRGWGTLAVVVELPPQTRALFSISISRRARKTAQTKSLKSREKAKWRIEDGLRRLNRFERPLREGEPTLFHWVPARRRQYYVTVRGPLMNASTGELIGDFLEEQLVRVVRGKRVSAKFDMRPKEASIEISVLGAVKGEKGSEHVAVALRGNPSSLRYVGDAPVFLYVKPARYVLLVGAGDRLLERVVEVKTFDPVKVVVDVARDAGGALFSGSAAAVKAFLEGDLSRAADELERAGQTQAATKLRADLLQKRGDVAGASRALETAGDLRGAAELRAKTEDRAGAAALFEAAGELDKAGDAYRAAGDMAAAARAYERAGELDQAIECCRETQDTEHLLALLEKNECYFDAGQVAASLQQTKRAIHNLSQVDALDPNWTAAARQLVELQMQRGQLGPALEKLDELLEVSGEDSPPLPLQAVKAELLEKLSRFDDAIEAWEVIEARDPSFRNSAERVAELRAKHAPAAAPADAQAESRYEILEELGRGAMGVVYKARDKHLGRTVALKRLTENLRGHPTAIAFFEREARAAAALNHPNIVTVYDAGSEGGHYFITMEFLQGTTLDSILRARGAMAAPIVAAIGMQVCAGLHYAHTARIVHRDVKTANLFYTRERVLKIMDFGLAKMVEEVRKGATVIGGTPFYMAPEQAAGESVDHRADLYALGVTLFELLTKSVPFRAGDVTFHHRNTPAPDPRERKPEIPEAMARLVMKLMAKRPEERCQSAVEVASALQPIAGSG